MHPLFLGSFLLGLLLAVFSMLHGVERRPAPAAASPRGPGGEDLAADDVGGGSARATARLNLPLLAGFATVFGATGYLLHRYSPLAPLPSAGIAALVGAAGALGAVTLVARWALGGSPLDTEDPRYVLQGHLARVTAPIEGERGGEIAFVVDGLSHVVPARSLDGGTIPLDAEVVIERIEDDVAHVERWAVVEERL